MLKLSNDIEPVFEIQIDLKAEGDTVGSFFIMVPESVYEAEFQMLIGSVTVGDSTNSNDNELCADFEGSGFYTCDTPINGRYIHITT